MNLSVLDGWWCEGYKGKTAGPSARRSSREASISNEVDIESLFHTLETQVVPLYYAKPDGKLPIAWLRLMRESILSVTPVYNTHRMVTEYNERLYEPAAKAYHVLNADTGKQAVELSDWKNKMRRDWPQIRIGDVQLDHADRTNIQVGDRVGVQAQVHLGPTTPAEVKVQVYYGENRENSISQPTILELTSVETVDKSGVFLYKGAIPSTESGAFGLSVRVVPTHPNLTRNTSCGSSPGPEETRNAERRNRSNRPSSPVLQSSFLSFRVPRFRVPRFPMIVIVGAGLAGLVCAKELARCGVRDFLLLEAEDEPGGRVRSSRRTADGFVLDRGFQVLLDSYPRRPPTPRPPCAGAALLRQWRDPVRRRGIVDGRPPVAPPGRRGPRAPLARCSRPPTRPGSSAWWRRCWPHRTTACWRRLPRSGISVPHTTSGVADFRRRPSSGFFARFLAACFSTTSSGPARRSCGITSRNSPRAVRCSPAAGIGEIPRQLASALPRGTLRLGCRVESIERLGDRGPPPCARTLANGVSCERLVLATEAPATARLLERPRLAGPPALGTTVLYFASDVSVYARPLLVLPAGRAKLVRHFVELTNVAPGYAPPGKHLLAATVLDRRGLDDRALADQAAREIAACFPAAAGNLELIAFRARGLRTTPPARRFFARFPFPARAHLLGQCLARRRTNRGLQHPVGNDQRRTNRRIPGGRRPPVTSGAPSNSSSRRASWLSLRWPTPPRQAHGISRKTATFT